MITKVNFIYLSFIITSLTHLSTSCINQKADLAVASITITEERSKVVDYTVPFQHYTNNLLFKRPEKDYDMLAFVEPLSRDIWFCLAATVCFVGTVMYWLNYLSPYGCKDENGKGTAKELSFLNSLWFSLACILQQGTSDRPKAISGTQVHQFNS